MGREGEGRGGKGAIETKRRPLTGVTPSVADPFKQTHGVAANLRWTMRPREHGPDCFIDPNFYFGEQIDGKKLVRGEQHDWFLRTRPVHINISNMSGFPGRHLRKQFWQAAVGREQRRLEPCRFRSKARQDEGEAVVPSEQMVPSSTLLRSAKTWIV